jgi:hypothetical protein
MSLLLLAPDARRLVNVLLLDRPALPSIQRPLFGAPNHDGRSFCVRHLFDRHDVASARISW